MVLQSIKWSENGNLPELEVLDQLLLPEMVKYLKIKGVEDGWSVINKMQVCVDDKFIEFCLRKDKKKTLLHYLCYHLAAAVFLGSGSSSHCYRRKFVTCRRDCQG
jgi:hypothetical protein